MIYITNIQEFVPELFDFTSAATSYGWVDLPPNKWVGDEQTVVRVERLNTGKVIILKVRMGGRSLNIRVEHTTPTLLSEEIDNIRSSILKMFRLNEDFSDFYKLCKKYRKENYEQYLGKGHLMRSPTVFEDIIKTICTTNTTWAGTKRMVSNIVQAYGTPYPADSNYHSFPTPKRLAEASEQSLKALGLGYRAQYIQTFACQVESGIFSPESLQSTTLCTTELKRMLLTIKGVGPYAANTMLMLLGKYGELAIDSEMRSFVQKKYYHKNKNFTDKEIRKLYDKWGDWKYLAYWFDSQ